MQFTFKREAAVMAALLLLPLLARLLVASLAPLFSH